MANPCLKKVTVETAYEVWENGSFTYWVLKKYQAPEKEQENTYARWHCAVKSPSTHGSFEYGDVYCSTVKLGGRIIANPLIPTTGQGGSDGSDAVPTVSQ